MSLRIQNDAATNDITAEVSRSGHSDSVSSGAGKTQVAAGSDGGDHVDVSSILESISAGVSAQNVHRADRVTQLSALYGSGKYTVDSAQLSQAIVSSAITVSSAGKA